MKLEVDKLFRYNHFPYADGLFTKFKMNWFSEILAAQPSLGFTESEKQHSSSEQQLYDRKCLVDVRAEWPDCFKLTGRRPELKKPLITTKVRRINNSSKPQNRRAKAAEDDTWFHYCQLKTENSGYNHVGSPKLDNRRRLHRLLPH